jgi:hypothetical protein
MLTVTPLAGGAAVVRSGTMSGTPGGALDFFQAFTTEASTDPTHAFYLNNMSVVPEPAAAAAAAAVPLLLLTRRRRPAAPR